MFNLLRRVLFVLLLSVCHGLGSYLTITPRKESPSSVRIMWYDVFDRAFRHPTGTVTMVAIAIHF